MNIESLSIDEFACGFYVKGDKYTCIHCGESFEEGRVYKTAEGLVVARRAACAHVASEHGGPFLALAGLGAAGLPEAQERVLRLRYEGLGDQEIAVELGGKAVSTVRNHRLALRRREVEARAFLALARLVEQKRESRAGAVAYPEALTVSDERTKVTPDEAELIEGKYLRVGREGAFSLASWPRKQKEKLVLLLKISRQFDHGRGYSEREVNAVLQPIWPDYAELRRYLVEYGFLSRKPDCSEYRRER